MEWIFKLCLLAFCCIVVAALFQSNQKEYGMLLALFFCVLIASTGLKYFLVLRKEVLGIMNEFTNGSSYLALLIKVVGIVYISNFTADVCKDAGYHAMSGQIQTISKLIILVNGIPLIQELLRLLNQFV